ncbi:MAG: plastocyanin/azurin family copper-binding protein [Gaiellaceae bacterium]
MIRTAAILGAALALVLGAAACGGGGSSEETTTEQATTEQTTTEGGGGGGGSGSASGTLEGETGPGFEIEVKQNGEDAESVKAGTYTLKVEDKSASHNFHLIGPGVDEKVTDVGFVGDKTVTVTLKQGTYTYQCDPHASSGMKDTFEVT